MKLSFGYFWSLTISGEDQGERRTGNAYEHESYTKYDILIRLGKGTTTKRTLNSSHLKFCWPAMQTPSVGEVCEYPEVSSLHASSYLQLEMVLVLASCSIKRNKNVRGVAMVTILSSSSMKHHGKYSQCPTFDFKQSPSGRSPEDHQVRAHASLHLNEAQSCFMLPLSVLLCSSLNVCHETHS